MAERRYTRRGTAMTRRSSTCEEIAEIELFIIKRMKEFTLGDHASVFKGAGFNFVGVRDWEPGDRMSSIDWAQSSLTNFSPLITRDFEQDSNATIVAVADASLSTRCGVAGVTIAAAIARAVAAAGLSAMFFQDLLRAGHLRRSVPAAGLGASADRPLAPALLPRPVSPNRAHERARIGSSDIIVGDREPGAEGRRWCR